MPADHSLQGFTLYVDENSHDRDEDARYTQGVYVTYEEALTVAKGMLERDLQASLGKGMSGKEWLEGYFMFGEDPWISPTPDGMPKFSAWDYARELAERSQ